MKIKFKSPVQSNLAAADIRAKILSQLRKENYLIISDQPDHIFFELDQYYFLSRLGSMGRFDSGNFKLTKNEDGVTIEITNFESFLPAIIFPSFFLVASILSHHFEILLFAALSIVIFLFRLSNLKSTSEDILETIKE